MFSFKRPPVRAVPNCNKCVYFKALNRKCKLFKYTFPKINGIDELLVNAEVCRKEHTMCGSTGMFFKENNFFNWSLKPFNWPVK